MSRLSLLLFVAVTACGAPAKPIQTAPLPDDKPATPTPVADKPKEDTPPEPPKPIGPVEATLPGSKVTVKLVAPGKGKRAPLRYTSKAGGKQQIEVAMDFAAKQTEAGKPPADQVVPTMVLAGEAETKAIDKDGNATYALTVSSTDVREVAGSKPSAAEFKPVFSSITGLVISSSLGSNGAAGDVAMRIEKPTDMSAGALVLVGMTLPQFPVLPAEPVGVGAKWQATSTAKVAGKFDVTQVTDYELVAHQGATWTIKSKTKVTGADQDVGDGTKVSGIKGSGTTDVTLADGALYPSTKGTLETQFTVSEGAASVQFALKIGGAVTPAKK